MNAKCRSRSVWGEWYAADHACSNKVQVVAASSEHGRRLAPFPQTYSRVPREPNAKRDPRKGGPRGLNQRQLFDSVLTEAPKRTPDLHRCRSPRCSSAPSRRTYGAIHNDDPGQSHQVGRHQQGRVVTISQSVHPHRKYLSTTLGACETF